MPILTSRQTEILVLAGNEGRVMVEDLATRFSVTPQTIRKDLNELCDKRHMQRLHGGATIASGVENLRYEARRTLASTQKQAIGEAAAELIANNTSLFVNIGTTTERVAASLLGHHGLLVITNNINVATLLYPNDGIEVIIAGGMVRRADGGVVGEATADFISQFKVDFAVIGASAIDSDGALLDFDYREVRVARAIIANARQVILVADAMKFDRSAPVRIGHLSQIDWFVTDRLPTPEPWELCRDHGVRVIETTRVEQPADELD